MRKPGRTSPEPADMPRFIEDVVTLLGLVVCAVLMFFGLAVFF